MPALPIAEAAVGSVDPAARLSFQLSHPSSPIVGPRHRADTEAMLAAVHRHFVPNKVVLLADGDESLRALAAAHS